MNIFLNDFYHFKNGEEGGNKRRSCGESRERDHEEESDVAWDRNNPAQAKQFVS